MVFLASSTYLHLWSGDILSGKVLAIFLFPLILASCMLNVSTILSECLDLARAVKVLMKL